MRCANEQIREQHTRCASEKDSAWRERWRRKWRLTSLPSGWPGKLSGAAVNSSVTRSHLKATLFNLSQDKGGEPVGGAGGTLKDISHTDHSGRSWPCGEECLLLSNYCCSLSPLSSPKLNEPVTKCEWTSVRWHWKLGRMCWSILIQFS